MYDINNQKDIEYTHCNAVGKMLIVGIDRPFVENKIGKISDFFRKNKYVG